MVDDGALTPGGVLPLIADIRTLVSSHAGTARNEQPLMCWGFRRIPRVAHIRDCENRHARTQQIRQQVLQGSILRGVRLHEEETHFT